MSKPGASQPSAVLVVDDDLLVRRALSDYLTIAPDMELAAALAGAEEALRYVDGHPVDLVLMDVRMPGMDGIEAARLLHQRHPSLGIVMLTSFDDDDLVRASIKAGALGYVLKSARAPQIIAALRSARLGMPVVSPEVFADMATDAPPRPGGQLPPLTRREAEVLHHLCQGRSNAEIAAELYLAQSSVKMHMRSLMEKLGTHSRLETVVLAHECGFSSRPRQ